MLHFLAIVSLLDRHHLPLHLRQRKPPDRRLRPAAEVAKPSFVRWLSCVPDSVAALVEIL
jgi:hypothetical protein